MNTEFILNMFVYLIIYSFFGWILESIYKTAWEKQFVNSGFLKGPYCPIYGLAAIFMILTLNFLKGKIILLFIVSFIVLSIWEYIVGVFLEKVFKQKYWDYTNYKLNINGRVCLINSIFWGVLGVVFIEWVHPFVENIIHLIPEKTLLYSTIVIYIIFIVDIITTILSMAKFTEAIEKINELSEKIKINIEQLKENAINSQAKSKLEELIRKLKLQQSKIKLNLYREARRLQKAFPTMKSEKISNFLSEKIDIEALKKIKKKNSKKENSKKEK